MTSIEEKPDLLVVTLFQSNPTLVVSLFCLSPFSNTDDLMGATSAPGGELNSTNKQFLSNIKNESLDYNTNTNRNKDDAREWNEKNSEWRRVKGGKKTRVS